LSGGSAPCIVAHFYVFYYVVRESLEASKNMFLSYLELLPNKYSFIDWTKRKYDNKCSTGLYVAVTKKYAAMMSRRAMETGFEAAAVQQW